LPFGVKIDTIKIDDLLESPKKVGMERVEDGDPSSNSCKTRKLCEHPPINHYLRRAAFK